MTEKNIRGNIGGTLIAVLGLPEQPWLLQALGNTDFQQQQGLLKISLVCSTLELEQRCSELTRDAMGWQKKLLKKKDQRVVQFSTDSCPHILVDLTPAEKNSKGMLEWVGDYALARDLMGQVYAMVEQLMAEQIDIDFGECTDESVLGSLVGLEMAAYDYRHCRGDRDSKQSIPGLRLKCSPAIADMAAAQGHAVNIARHLVNLPAADLNPQTYAGLVEEMFNSSATSTVEVWGAERLKSEKLGLMLAVGGAAVHPPCLIHIRYRRGDSTRRPVALVGKGITFDTGGLDLKPSAFMRMMKKDMGGSAALVGLADWIERTGFKHPVDIWLAVAENAVGEKAFRPGDVITARNGRTVEIDNTDAEGRLVLADALTIAVSEQNENQPGMVIDVATLTGAARVALGLQVGAMFANDKKLSDALYDSSIEAGDPLWPLPLVSAYKNELQSHVAQLANSSANRFGGAVTAAMFLAEFTEEVAWAHIDINAWTNETQGPIKGPGANGQMVQCLINFLENDFEC
ncbi:MAG: leucyl aminopeptidase family protein [Pseudomonadota bacterium]|nr:leucyl aminopeptidase family protein [Pseudomonadota bacterium]